MNAPAVTVRLYRDDPYATRLEATVERVAAARDAIEVELDRTIFHPTAGGQQHDRGILAGRPVVDVRVSDDGLRIVHVLDGSASLAVGERVEGELDWARRRDLMQQHTGEHILGQAFFRLGYGVVAVHMGEELCTIDLVPTSAGVEPGAAVLCQAERLANEAIWAALPVSTFEVEQSEIASLPLRRPPQVAGRVRIVRIGDFDWSACGGTHLRSSAEAGLVKILRAERTRGATRVSFNCGWRALADYRAKHDFALGLARDLSTSTENLPARSAALLGELATARREMAALRTRTAEATAASWVARAAGEPIVKMLDDPSLLGELARVLAGTPGVLAILGARSDRAGLAVAVGPGVAADAGALLRVGLPLVDGRGGGKASLAQGTGPRVDGLQGALAAIRAAV